MIADFFNAYGMELIGAVLVAIFGAIGMAVKRAACMWLDTSEKREIARIAVRFVEQTCKALHGEDKFDAALLEAARLLNNKHVNTDADELKTMIEAAVQEMNAQITPPLAIEVAELHEEEGESDA